MKKILTYWHIFYCSMIAVLVYLYFSSIWYDGQYANSNESRTVMISMCKSLENSNHNLLEKIQFVANRSGDTTLKPQVKATIDLVEHERKYYEYIGSIQTQLWRHCGGEFSDKDPRRMLRYKYYFPYKNFFDTPKISEIKEKINQYADSRNKIIDQLNTGKNPNIIYSPMLSDSTFWTRIQECSPTHALQKLDELMYSSQINEGNVLERYLEKISPYKINNSCYEPQLDIIFEPLNIQNQDYIEGYFKVVKTTFLCQERNYKCLINGKKIGYKDGKAYVKYKPKKLGENLINVKLLLKNPATGDSSTMPGGAIFYAK